MSRLASYDLETHLIQPGLVTPPIVCGSSAWRREDGSLASKLCRPKEAIDLAWQYLTDPETVLVLANAPFDMGCLAVADPQLLKPIFKAYAEGRIFDVLVAHALHAIYHGHLYREPTGLPLLNAKGRQTDRYSLAICVRHCLGRGDAKDNDFWKLRYAMLEPLAFEDWPEEARQYPLDDAQNTILVAEHQMGLDGSEMFDNLQDLPDQVETDWGLHLGAMWGLRTDESRIKLLVERAEELHRVYLERFTKKGFFRAPREEYTSTGRVDPDAGKKDTAAVARACAVAYGASGVCPVCDGVGRVRRGAKEPCRGAKARGRFPGCAGTECGACGGTGEVIKLGNKVLCTTCGATGFEDISTVPRTDTDGISTSRDTLAESGDDELIEFGENKQEKILKTYKPFLEQGIHQPIVLEPNVLVDSGRTSYRGVIQLFPRGALAEAPDKRWVPTTRECIVARRGRVLGSCDYAAGELVALSQVCLWLFGESQMATIINTTRDPGSLHTWVAAKMIGESVEVLKQRIKDGDKVAKGFRQAGKPLSFGFPGGMGSAKVVLTNRKEGAGKTEAPDGYRYPGIRFCILVDGATRCGVTKLMEWNRQPIPPTCSRCLELVEHQLKPLWFETFPEVRELHRWVKRTLDDDGDRVPCFGPWFREQDSIPHRMRGEVNFTAASNNCFQSMIADTTKDALRRVTREAYTDESSCLYQASTRIPVFQHDELLFECDEALAPEVGERVSSLMMDAFHHWIPDVYGEAESCLMRAWSKDAATIRDKNGRLLVWEPKRE